MVVHNSIPFLDLLSPHQQLKEELIGVFRTALGNATFIGGPMVETFEREFAAACDVRHCIGVSSGTDALRFALMATGVKPGNSVITVPNTFIATGEAITQAGALPEFVDVDPRTYNLDPNKLREYLEENCVRDSVTRRTLSRRTGRPVTAVVPVHLYGQMADMDEILEIAEVHKLMVIEDACQAHGAEYFSRKLNRWCKAGSMGKAAAFSFYPGKNLGACGEAGAVTTNNDAIAKQVAIIRDHGQAKKYHHDVEGYNGRLDAIQAGILSVKLKYLPEWNTKRREAAARYNEIFANCESRIIAPYEPTWSRAVYHLYVIQCVDREGMQDALRTAGIGTGIHYPIPLHLQNAYISLGYHAGDFPVTEAAAKQILSLPMSTTLRAEQQERVVEKVLQQSSQLCEAAGD